MQPPLAADAGAGFGEAPPPAAGTDAAAPLAVLRYTLRADDIAAHLARSRADRRRMWQGLVSAAFASLLALNFLAGKLPVPDSALLEAAEIAAILGGPALLALWLLRRDRMERAAEDLPAPVEVALHIHADHAVEHRPDLPRPRPFRARSARRIDCTRRHLVMETDAAALVVPVRAFASPQAMRQQARDWAARMR
jgi:hypothetical protein